MINDVLCRGLENSEIQMELLGEKEPGYDIGAGFLGKGGREEIGIPPLGYRHSHRKLLQEAEENSTKDQDLHESGGRNAQPLAQVQLL